jgi:hypothetical protein
MNVPPYRASLVVLVFLALIACSGGGSGGPQTGTSDWYWQAAQDNFNKSDFRKTQEHLEHLVDSDSPRRQQAAVWRTVVLAGLVRGYKELGDAYSEVARKQPPRAGQLQNSIQQYRRDARQFAIALTESMTTVRKLAEGSDKLTLDFAFPTGSANVSPALESLKSGQAPPPNQLQDAEKETLQRGMMLQAAGLVGAKEEVNRARTMFESRPVEVSRTDFFLSLGESMYSLSDLFGQKSLNEPKIRKVMLQAALDCLTPALEAQDAKLKQQAEKLKKEIETEHGKIKV